MYCSPFFKYYITLGAGPGPFSGANIGAESRATDEAGAGNEAGVGGAGAEGSSSNVIKGAALPGAGR